MKPALTICRSRCPLGLASASFVFALALGACGGPRATEAPPLPPPVLLVPERYAVPADAERVVPLSLDGIPTLPEAFESVRLQLIDAGFSPFDPARANQTHAASDFAHYLTAQEETLDRTRVHHVVFVVPQPWQGDQVDRFVQAFYALPGLTPAEAGVPVFHLVSAAPAPFALQYLFGNHWSGTLESLLLHDYAELVPAVDRVGSWSDLARARFSEFGLVFDTPEASLASLEYLLAQLPRDAEQGSYRPIGTLAAIGLLFGDLVHQRFPDLVWTEGEPVLATLYAMQSQRDPDIFLRPIDYVVQAWSEAPDGTPLADYLDLLGQRLAAP